MFVNIIIVIQQKTTDQIEELKERILSFKENTDSILERFASDCLRNGNTRLQNILERIESKKIYAGVIGVSKAGKTSLLNNLLTKNILPSSVQPQTAREVIIVHSPSKPDGELHVVNSKSLKVEMVIKGCDKINKYLADLNNNARDSTSIVKNKLYLYATLSFLKDKDDIHFEISDTSQRLGEAAGDHFTNETNIAIRDMAAFIVVLNYELEKSVQEKDLMVTLSKYHPDLFSDTHGKSRILVLVNHYEESFTSLQASEIPEHVSNYLKGPEFLDGKTIPQQSIIPVSTLLAYRARELESNDSSNIRSSMSILKKAGYIEKHKSVKDVSERMVCDHLKNLSNIHIVEKQLKVMLYENAEETLLSSCEADFIAITDVMTRELDDLVQREVAKADQGKKKCHDLEGMLKSVKREQTQLKDKLHTLNMTNSHYSDCCKEFGEDIIWLVDNKLHKLTTDDESYDQVISKVIHEMSVLAQAAEQDILRDSKRVNH